MSKDNIVEIIKGPDGRRFVNLPSRQVEKEPPLPELSDSAEVREIFIKAAKKAALKLVEQLDSNSSAQAISAAMKILEGAGMSPKRAPAINDRMAAGLNIVILDNPPVKVIDHDS